MFRTDGPLKTSRFMEVETDDSNAFLPFSSSKNSSSLEIVDLKLKTTVNIAYQL